MKQGGQASAKGDLERITEPRTHGPPAPYIVTPALSPIQQRSAAKAGSSRFRNRASFRRPGLVARSGFEQANYHITRGSRQLR